VATRTSEGRILLNEIELRRFYSFCVVDLVTGCWNWTGTVGDGVGYGTFSLKLDDEWITRSAHIISYNHFVGAVPEGFELGHYNFSDGTFDKCAFWEHVRPVTHVENMAERRSTVCKHGHDTRVWGRTQNGNCSVCNRVRTARQYGHIYCSSCGYNPCRCSYNP